MKSNTNAHSSATENMEDEQGLKRGPWSVEEDLLLMNYINQHGEGQWNSLARCAGLKRTGKSCRLRWLNYLRPDVRRGNITPEEQLLILELHSRWGNRWSKIAQYLPGRTDNEVKNYWRTRVQKHAKQLRCDVNSKQFKDMMRYQWVPRLEERIRAASAASAAAAAAASGGSETAARRDDELSQEMAGGQENSNAVGSESESCEMQASSGSLSDCFASSVQGREDGSEAAWFLETGEFGGGGWPGDGTCDGLLAAGFDPCGWDGSLWSMEDIWLMQGI